jgi:hypothetical protein
MPRKFGRAAWFWPLVVLAAAAEADVPSPPHDVCRDAQPGTQCSMPGPNGPVKGQCVPSTCRTPGAQGREYPCTYCSESAGGALGYSAPAYTEPSSVASFEPAQPDPALMPASAPVDLEETDDADAERGIPSLLLGVMVLGAGVVAVVVLSRSRG